MLVSICIFCLKCTKFGQSILSKIVATRRQISISASDPAGGLTALPQTPQQYLRGLFLRGGKVGRGGREKAGKGKRGERKGETRGKGKEATERTPQIFTWIDAFVYRDYCFSHEIQVRNVEYF